MFRYFHFPRFLHKLFSRSIREFQLTYRDREHTVSWIRVKCCINVQRIATEKACNLWMTSKVIQGHHSCRHLIGHIRFPISLHCKYICILHRFRDINTYLPKSIDVTWHQPLPLWGQFVVTRLILLGPNRVDIWRFYVHPLQRNLRACKILKWIT